MRYESYKAFIQFNITYVICMLFVCHSYVILCQSYAMICHLYVLYVLFCHPYLNCMYSFVIRMSLVCTRMSSVCHSYVFVCHSYVTRMYLYVIRMSLVCGFTTNQFNLVKYSIKVINCYNILLFHVHSDASNTGIACDFDARRKKNTCYRNLTTLEKAFSFTLVYRQFRNSANNKVWEQISHFTTTCKLDWTRI